jgi:NosR/NirI family transcriptional regulator, nitrous oxide reductase regulator
MPAAETGAIKNPLRAYARWLHTRWPAGRVEPLPEIDRHLRSSVAGIYVTGDLTGIPLLKFALDTGVRAVRTIAADAEFRRLRAAKPALVHDLAIVGAGVSGLAAAAEARSLGLDFIVLEAKRRFQTVADFPRGKPIYTYPREMRPAGAVAVAADVKEALLEELERQTSGIEVQEAAVRVVRREGAGFRIELERGEPVRALRVIVAIGRSGGFRKLGVPGEEREHVHNRLHDPRDFVARRAVVVGGGDSAVETAIALASCGVHVVLCHRGPALSRPKPENVEHLERLLGDPAADATTSYLGADRRPGSIRVELETDVREIAADAVVLGRRDGSTMRVDADVVFSMIGREAPLDFFRRSGLRLRGEWSFARVAGLAAFVSFCLWLYHWKAPYAIPFGLHLPSWSNPDPSRWMDALARLGPAFADPATGLGTLRISASSPGFWYSLAYSLVIVIFGWRRIRRRRTPYVTVQTATLAAIQVLPLFVLPELLLPWLGHNGWFDAGLGRTVADALFPLSEWSDHGREYWRAVGLVLAWPLFVWNWFTAQPLWGWLVIGALQTFAIVPALVYFWGKGAYCGWICSCGALAETLGDAHRHKMPHGPSWNRLNLAGQVVLAIVSLLMVLRIAAWAAGDGSWPERLFRAAHTGVPLLNYAWLVDLMLAGVLGYGLYFWFSGRVWCRFFCPLAALMHVYARLGRFRILADKPKCISCNVCTSVCHQGIDVMSFANKGLPMADPECVRCSACVESCPTGVLYFGQVDRTGSVVAVDRLAASPVRMRERG